MGKANGRNNHITFSLSQENADFIREFGGAKVSGDGRYNFSELIDDFVTEMRGGGSAEQQALYLQAQREALLAQLQELEVRAKTSFGTTLDDFLSHVQATGKADAARAKDSAQAREKQRQEYLGKLVDLVPGHLAGKQLRDHLKMMKDELLSMNITIQESYIYITEHRQAAADHSAQARAEVLAKVRPIIGTCGDDTKEAMKALKSAGLQDELRAVGLTMITAINEVRNNGGAVH